MNGNGYVIWKWFVIVLFLTGISSCQNNPPEDMTDPGALIYWGYSKKDVNCIRCHGPEGAGGPWGSDLRHVFSKYSEGQIIEIIKQGRGHGSKHMPGFANKLTDREIHYLIDYLKTLQITPNR